MTFFQHTSKRQHRRWSGLLHSGLLVSLCCALSQAQVPTRIRPDGTLGTVVTPQGHIYAITGGRRPHRGPNLFHSFEYFNVGTDDIAQFQAPAGIENILSRVTGGEQSRIDGQISSPMPGVHLYLLNPSGVLFGPDARLDVQGSFHVSTADYLRLADGATFSTHLGEHHTLTVAPPTAFGFLRENPASITVQGSTLEVPPGQTFSVIGGDITVREGALRAPGGRFNLASVKSPGLVTPSLANEPPRLDLEGFTRLGKIEIADSASINANGDQGGTVVIRGGRLLAIRGGIQAQTLGSVDGGGIDIDVVEDVVLAPGFITSDTRGVGNAGGIYIKANHLQVSGEPDSGIFSNLGARTFSRTDNAGNAGDIRITTESILVKDNVIVSTSTFGPGMAGNLRIDTGDLQVLGVEGSASLDTNTFGSGNAGALDINAKKVRIQGGFEGFVGLTTQVSSSGQGDSQGGALRVHADHLEILDGAQISSTVFRGAGQAGDIEIQANTIRIAGRNDSGTSPGLFAGTEGGPATTGSGGNIHITTKGLQLIDGGGINTFSNSSGDGGNIELQSHEATITNAFMQSGAFSQGNSGNITIKIIGKLEIREAGNIFTGTSSSATGNSGNLDLTARDILITGISTSRTPSRPPDFTGIAAATNATEGGNSGEIRITATNISVLDKGRLTTTTVGSGKGGDITLHVSDTLQVRNGGQVLALTAGTGPAGNINIRAPHVSLSGINSVPIIDETGGRAIETLAPSAISTQTQLLGGPAGNIQLQATNLEVLDGAVIDAQTFGPGQGGEITIHADTVIVAGVSSVRSNLPLTPGRANISSATESQFLGDAATGDAGTLRIHAKSLTVRDGGAIRSDTTSPGAGGNLILTTDSLTLTNDARITSTSSRSPHAGKAGNITITAQDVFQSEHSSVSTEATQAEGGTVSLEAGQIYLRNRARLSARSTGAGNAGELRISATDALVSENSTITTEAAQADGGNITITAPALVRLRDSTISATVGGGPQTTGGNITITPASLVVQNSQIQANAFAGRGGNIHITANVFLADPTTQVSASSTLGIDGAVDVRAPTADLSGQVVPLSQQPLPETLLLRDRCAARLREGTVSSFVIREREGTVSTPDQLFPSRFVGVPAAPSQGDAAALRSHPLSLYQTTQASDHRNNRALIAQTPHSMAHTWVLECQR